MHIEPYLVEEIGSGKSGFAVNRDAVNRGFTVQHYKYKSITLIEPEDGVDTDNLHP